MKKQNTIIDNGNGTSTIVIDSKKYGVKEFIIDSSNVSVINGFCWSVSKLTGNFYASTSTYKTNGKKTTLYLHAMINGTPMGYVTDHVDQNTLNNTQKNLRSVTRQQNLFNMKDVTGYSKLASGRYRAMIMVNKKYIHLGVYDTAEEAHTAYLTAKQVLHKI